MADKRRRDEKNLPDPFSYCEMPQLTRRGMVWKEIEVTTVSESSGRGLIAKKELPKDLCIPYGGIYRTHEEMTAISKHSNENGYRRISHGAEVEVKGARGKKEQGMMDAHPQLLQERGVPEGAWPGGYCNQANRREDQNADLLQHDGKCDALPYAYMDDKCRNLFVKLRRPVAVGEEILVDYGYSVTRQTRWGFGFDAKLPKVKSDYTLRKRKPMKKYGETQIIE